MRIAGIFLFCLTLPCAALDLRQATVVVAPTLGPVEKKAATVLVEEVALRSGLTLAIAGSASGPAIVLERGSGPAEGFSIRTAASRVTISGNDARGVLFGVGALLRNLRMTSGAVGLPDAFSLTTAPKTRLRGHQLGYRPKTNSYDGWTIAMWDRYIRELALFGTNAIELIPPRSDDDANSPHFPLPQMETMIAMSRIIDSYGLDVWIWYPALDPDYANPKTVESALAEWGEVFRQLPRVDAVFVPGGDPGHTQPKYMMALLEKETAVLHKYHPKAEMWMSPQGFSAEWTEEFFEILKAQPKWLAGIVHGPQVRLTIPELRRRVPARYPIRNYPDITHSLRAEFAVPDWDLAYALTLEREPINPRPLDQAHIFRLFNPETIGFLTYSEGCNDDLNKFVWSALGWDPEADISAVLREYGRLFFGPGNADAIAEGILALERNWRGGVLGNQSVETTLASFQALERKASPAELLNWRFQQLLYRAYYDAYVRDRLIAETAAESRALALLRDAHRTGSLPAMDAASQALTAPLADPPSSDLRNRVFQLAEALYQSIRMQLDSRLYRGIPGRGTNLDTIDSPLNNRLWWEDQFTAVRALASEKDRLGRLDSLLNRSTPPPGGLHDLLGDPRQRPHLVTGAGWKGDPYSLESPRTGFRVVSGVPIEWWSFAETQYVTPLKMHYKALNPNARYRVRVVMAGDVSTSTRKLSLRLMADGKYQVHDYLEKPVPLRPVDFGVPVEATQDGELELEWSLNPQAASGNGRGCQIAEVWLYPAP